MLRLTSSAKTIRGALRRQIRAKSSDAARSFLFFCESEGRVKSQNAADGAPVNMATRFVLPSCVGVHQSAARVTCSTIWRLILTCVLSCQ